MFGAKICSYDGIFQYVPLFNLSLNLSMVHMFVDFNKYHYSIYHQTYSLFICLWILISTIIQSIIKPINGSYICGFQCTLLFDLSSNLSTVHMFADFNKYH